MTTKLTFSWLSLSQQWCYTLSYNSQRKVKVRRIGTKSPTKANTDHHNGDLK